MRAVIPKQRQDSAEHPHPHPRAYPHPLPGQMLNVIKGAKICLAAPCCPGQPLALSRAHPSSRGKGMPWHPQVILAREPGRAIVSFTFCELKDWVQWYKTNLSWDLRAGSVGS